MDLSTESVIYVLFILSLGPIAYQLTRRLLRPRTASRKYRFLFMWHAFDALVHLVIEGSFLYECFFSYAKASGAAPHFLGSKRRLYGPAFGKWPTARLWQEYAKADHRWAMADPTVVSIELLSVLVGGPSAVYACHLVRRASHTVSLSTKRLTQGRFWMVATVLATAELHGCFMTFVPELLTLCPRLDWKNPMYLILYLFAFNGIWVVCPILVLRAAFAEIQSTFLRLQK